MIFLKFSCWPNSMTYKTALKAITLVFLIHLVAVFFNLYEIWLFFDIPMHTAGGFVMGLLGLAIHHQMVSKAHNLDHPLHHFLFVIGFVMLVGVAWEFYEFIFDETIAAWQGWGRAQLSLQDTMGDFYFDAVGGLLSYLIFRRFV